MFVFGHTGLTLGSAIILAGLFTKGSKKEYATKEGSEVPRAWAGPTVPEKGAAAGPWAWLVSLAGIIDIRILLLGSLLPDIIDKPIGRFFFRETFNNGRIFSHTLLFLILLTVGGLLLYRARHKTWLLVLAYGTFTHLILDGMWMNPRTFYWPLYGFSFRMYRISIWSWIMSILRDVLTHPWELTPEIVGMIIIAWLVWQLVRRRKLLTFLKYGRV